MEERLGFVSKGFDFLAAELAAGPCPLERENKRWGSACRKELDRIRERQRGLTAARDERLRVIRAEPETIRPGEVKFLVHALVVPSQEPEEMEALMRRWRLSP